jgi:hypothetical protein
VKLVLGILNDGVIDFLLELMNYALFDEKLFFEDLILLGQHFILYENAPDIFRKVIYLS